MKDKSNNIINNKVIAFPHKPGSGGPGSFQIRIEEALKNDGWKIVYDDKKFGPDVVFVVGGTKRLLWLLKMKIKKIPILYRLDGIGWLHKVEKVSLKTYLVVETRNWISKIIHAFLADKIVYQSEFVRNWWRESGWRYREDYSIIYNGVNLLEKHNYEISSIIKKRIVVLEGTIDYSPYAIDLINDVASMTGDDVYVELYGKFSDSKNKYRLNKNVSFNGFIDRKDVFKVFYGSVYLSLDINPACPNTVIEAMAAGAPVAAFDTGALPELVKNGAGEIVPYGSDPWLLGYPNVKELVNKIEDIFDQYQTYSERAKNLATDRFSLEKMFESYMAEIKSLTK